MSTTCEHNTTPSVGDAGGHPSLSISVLPLGGPFTDGGRAESVNVDSAKALEATLSVFRRAGATGVEAGGHQIFRSGCYSISTEECVDHLVRRYGHAAWVYGSLFRIHP